MISKYQIVQEFDQLIFALGLNVYFRLWNGMLVEYMHLVQLHLMILHCFLVRLSMFEFDFALRNHYTPSRYLYMVAVVPNRFYQRCLWMSGMVNSCVIFTPKRQTIFCLGENFYLNSPGTRVSAREFFVHNFRRPESARLIFSGLIEILISHNIKKKLELSGLVLTIKFLHGRVLWKFLKWQFRKF